MSVTSFYSREELVALGLASFGDNVLISRRASLYGVSHIQIGNHVRIDDFALVTAGPEMLIIGNHVHIACMCVLHGSAGITFEDFSGLSSRVAIYSATDDFSGLSLTNPTVPAEYKPGVRSGRVVLRKHAIVGTNSTLLPGVEIGEGAAIGAHSLVVRSCKPWTIYVGAPAVATLERKRDLLRFEEQLASRNP